MSLRIFKNIFRGLISFLLILILLLICWHISERRDNTPIVIETKIEEETIPYDMLEDNKDQYMLNISSNLPELEVYLPAMSISIMVEKYVEGMQCRFNAEGEHEGELELISEAMLLDELRQTGRYRIVPKNQKQLVTPLYSLAFQCVVRKSSGIRSLSELKNKRVVVGLRDSESELLTREIFKAHKIEYDDFVPVYLDLEDGIKAMEMGMVDCIAINDAVPSKSIATMAANFDITILPIDQVDLIDDIAQRLPGYEIMTIPSKTYKGMDRYVLTAVTKVLLVTERDTKLVIVYELTKALYDHMMEFKSIFPIDHEFKGDRINNKSSIFLHQGAAKYYLERELIWI